MKKVVSIVIIAILIGGITIYFWSKNNDDEPYEELASTNEQQEQIKDNIIEFDKDVSDSKDWQFQYYMGDNKVMYIYASVTVSDSIDLSKFVAKDTDAETMEKKIIPQDSILLKNSYDEDVLSDTNFEDIPNEVDKTDYLGKASFRLIDVDYKKNILYYQIRLYATENGFSFVDQPITLVIDSIQGSVTDAGSDEEELKSDVAILSWKPAYDIATQDYDIMKDDTCCGHLQVTPWSASIEMNGDEATDIFKNQGEISNCGEFFEIANQSEDFIDTGYVNQDEGQQKDYMDIIFKRVLVLGNDNDIKLDGYTLK